MINHHGGTRAKGVLSLKSKAENVNQKPIPYSHSHKETAILQYIQRLQRIPFELLAFPCVNLAPSRVAASSFNPLPRDLVALPAPHDRTTRKNRNQSRCGL